MKGILVRSFFFFSLTLLVGHAAAQNKPGTPLLIKKAKGVIKLDGVLDEPDWATASIAKDFYLNYPVDTAFAPFQSEARVSYDEHNFYVSFVCYDDSTADIVQSLRRDSDYDQNDNISIIIGPYNDAINGFFFTITPMGVQMEGTVSSGGASDDGYSFNWDNKWYSKVARYKDKWIAELAIPLKSFRFKDKLKEWNITFKRFDLKRNTSSSWIATPIQFESASFAYSGQLVWEDPSPAGRTNISLIPYVAGGHSEDREVDPAKTTNDLQAGFDAKIGVTPSLNLDLTVNPDFSQVEVDRQVINLTRFEFRFPERRQFFLENNDLYERAGFPEARPFFSRRVGLARDSSGSLKKVPILYGARLSGSLTKNWRTSLLNMQTSEKLSLGLPAQNYTVAALQRNFWKQSNISLIYVDKQSLGVHDLSDSVKYYNSELWKTRIDGSDTSRVLNDFNRVIGVDLDLRSADNKWYTSFYYGKSFDSFSEGENGSGIAFLQYTVRNFGLFAGQTFIQKNYNNEAGFVPSHGVYPGIFGTFLSLNGTFYPKESRIARMGPQLDLNVNAIPGGTITDKSLSLGYSISFLNTASFLISYGYTFQQLTNDFNTIDDEKYSVFAEGEEYSWKNIAINYKSNQRKLFKYSLGSTYGGFYNGSNFNVNGEVNYRYQPYGSLSLRFDYNDIDLPDTYGKEKLFLVSPRLDLTFTDKIFLTTFVQYNKLSDNVNLNARFQWRYKPASDFFVVYTENYLPENLNSKNRSLVFKLTYWLNL